MKYGLCLCDADGTLFDFLKGERAALAATLTSFSLPVTDECVALYSSINDGHWKRFERGETTQDRLRVDRFADFLSAMGRGDADARQMNLVYVGFLSQQHELMPGAMDFCRRVSAKMPIYLVTNGIASVQRTRLSLCEIREYLSGVVISEEVGRQKPDPEMIYEAMRQAGEADKRRVVMLGDSLTSDIRAAKNAGVDSVLFTNGKEPPEDGFADDTVKTLDAAADLILSA